MRVQRWCSIVGYPRGGRQGARWARAAFSLTLTVPLAILPVGRLVEVEAPNPYYGVCLCTGMYMNGTDVMQATRRFLDKIFFVQPLDLRGRWLGVEEVMPGEGEVDLKEFLRTLAASGYKGLVHPEHFEDTTRSLEDPEAEALS